MGKKVGIISGAWGVWRGTRAKPPHPDGHSGFDHGRFAPLLAELAQRGVGSLPELVGELKTYRRSLAAIDPDDLGPEHALAYWLNLYNAESLALTAEAVREEVDTVLRRPGAFSGKRVQVAGESLSLNQIEHGKIRRFGDPRIHGSLVCGTVSCPTLRFEPFSGERVDTQLDDQMMGFLAGGGMVADRDSNHVQLSRVLYWYGADFVRPDRMPGWIPPQKKKLLDILLRWAEPDVAAWATSSQPKITFQPYDWALGCSVR